MGVIFDTSVLIAIERGSVHVDRLVEGREDEPFGISVMTVAELLHGVHRADSEKRRVIRQTYVEKLLETFPAYSFDVSVARTYASVWANLARRGVRIGAHDLIIASTAISLGFSVVTSDMRDYQKITGLKVERA